MPLPDEELPKLVEPNAFAAAFSGQPTPGEDADAFVARRQKLSQLGALGPQTLPRSEKERQQGIDSAQQIQSDLAKSAERDARQAQQEQARAVAQQAREQATQARAQAAEQAKAAKTAEAAQQKQWREAGIVTRTTPEGKAEPDQHPDGTIKYKPDMLGDPYLDEGSGRYVRDYRDERGTVKPVDLEENGDLHTDAQTGERYYRGAGGLRVNLGPDDHWQQREAAKEELATLKNAQSVAAVELDQHQLALEPVKRAWSEQQAKTKSIREKLTTLEASVRATGDTGPAAEALKTQRAQWETMKPEYDRAKAEYDALTARETELRSGILDGKKRALEMSSRLDKLKARSWGKKATDAQSPADRANSALEAAQKELTEAQDAARTLNATASVAGNALTGGATQSQVGALKAAGDEAGKAVQAQLRTAAAKVQHLGTLTNQIKKADDEAAQVAPQVQKTHADMEAARAKVTSDMILGTISREEADKRLANISQARETAAKPLKAIESKRAAALGELAQYDDPKTWETTDLGLSLAEVDRQIEAAGKSSVEGAAATLQRAQESGVASLVEGKPIKEQIATLKAELQRRQAKTPRADYGAQLAMLDAASRANATGEEQQAAFKTTVADLVAQRDAESVTGPIPILSTIAHPLQTLDAAGHMWSEQAKSVGGVLADPNAGIVAKTLHYLGGNAGAFLGGLGTVVMGKTIADITRAEQAKEARQLIGNLDAAGAETVLRSLPTLEAQWKKSGTVLTPEQISAASKEGDAGIFSPAAEGSFRFAGGGKANGAAVALNRTLYGAEKVIKELEAQKPGAIADVASSALANALPFVSSGGIEVDENDAAQVAQRAFLRVKLHEAIQKHAPYLTISGSAIGSLLGFMSASGAARGAAGKLGLGAKAGTIGTGAIMGADMSLKDNEGNIGFVNRLADTAFKGITLMASERIGDAFGEKLQGMFGAASKAGRFTGRALGGAAGEFTSDLAQNAMEGKNALEGWQQSLAVNTGLGIGMAIVGAIADGKARRIGGKPLAPAYEGAMNAHTEAMAALDAAQQAGDAAQIAIATDTLKQTQAHLDLTTSQLTAVTDGTRRAIGNALGMDSKSLGTAIAENDVLATAGVAVGQEVRDVYLAGAREQAAIAAAMREKDFGGPEGTPLAQTVVDQHVGAAVARDLAGVADNSATLTADKINVLARLGLVEQAEDGGISITDDAVALLPPSMRTAIERNPSKFRVNITLGNEGKIIGQLTAQGRSIIAARVGGVTKAQAAKVASVVAATQPTQQGTVAQPAQESAWTVKIESTTPAGKATNQYRIVAATQQEAEAKAKQRVESIGGTVTGIGSKQEISPASQGVAGSEEPAVGPAASASTSPNEEATTPQQQGADPVQTGEAPAPAAETGKKAESAVSAEVIEDKAMRIFRNERKSQNVYAKRIGTTTDGGSVVSVFELGGDSRRDIIWSKDVYFNSDGKLIRDAKFNENRGDTKPKAEKPAQKPLTKTISEAFGRAMAGDAMAKSFGGLRVAIKKASDLGKGKYLQAHFNAADGTGFELRYNLDGLEVKVRQELGDKATPEAVRDFVEASLREELIHFAQFEALRLRWVDGGSVGPFGRAVEAEYAKLWDGLDRAQKAAIKKIYGHAMKPWQMGAEGVRQIVQWARDGKTTETVTQWLREKFAAALDVLRKLAGNPAATSKHLDETIKDVERVLAELENVPVTEKSSGTQKEGDIANIVAQEMLENPTGQLSSADIQRKFAVSNTAAKRIFVAAANMAMKPQAPTVKESLTVPTGKESLQVAPVAPAQSIANPDGVPDVSAPEVTADVASKQAFTEAVQATNAQAKPVISPELEALRKAQAAAFDGLDASPAQPEQVKLPPAKMAVFTGMAQQYLDAGIDTPQKLAAELDAAIGQKAHKYARAIWRAIGSGMDTWQDVADPAEWARMFEKPAGNETETAATPTEKAAETTPETKQTLFPRVLGTGLNPRDIAREYGLPSDFYEFYQTSSGPSGQALGMNKVADKYRTPEYEAAEVALENAMERKKKNGIPYRQGESAALDDALRLAMVGVVEKAKAMANAEQSPAPAPQTKSASFTEMVNEARRWKGAAMHADSLYAENDVNGRLSHSEATTKGALDEYLMRKFGVSASTARDVSNELTKKNLPPDESAVTGDFAGEAWADSALKQSPAPAPQSEGGALDTQGTESAPSDNPATPEPAANAGSGFNSPQVSNDTALDPIAEQWWNYSLTRMGRVAKLKEAGIDLPGIVEWKDLTAAERAKLDRLRPGAGTPPLVIPEPTPQQKENAIVRQTYTAPPAFGSLLDIPRGQKPLIAARGQVRTLIEKQAKNEGYDEQQVEDVMTGRAPLRGMSNRLIELINIARVIEGRMIGVAAEPSDGESRQYREAVTEIKDYEAEGMTEEESAQFPAHKESYEVAKRTKERLEKRYPKVFGVQKSAEKPKAVKKPVSKPATTVAVAPVAASAPQAEDEAAARETIRTAQAQLDALNEEYQGVKTQYEALNAEVTKTTGPKWERGQLKKSAPASKVKYWRDASAKMSELQRRMDSIRNDTRDARNIIQKADLRKRMMDEASPMIMRTGAELELAELNVDGRASDELKERMNALARTEILSRVPDATDAEIEKVIGRVVGIARNGLNLDDSFARDPYISVHANRRDELSKFLNPSQSRWADPRHLIKDFNEELQARITAKTAEFSSSFEKRPDVTPLSRAELDAIIAYVEKARREVARMKEIEAEQQQAAARAAAEAARKVDDIKAAPDKAKAIETAVKDAKGKTSSPKVIKAQYEYLADALKKAIAESNGEGRVRIQVPHDGTFILADNKEALRKFARDAKGAFTIQKPDVPTMPKVKAEPTKAPGKVADSEIVKALAPISERAAHSVVGDGERIFTSDGKMLVAIAIPNKGNSVELEVLAQNDDRLALSAQVTWEGAKAVLLHKIVGETATMPVEEMYRLVSMADAINDGEDLARVWLNKDGTAGVSLFAGAQETAEDNGYYEGNVDEDAKIIATIPVNQLRTAVEVASKAGETTLTLGATEAFNAEGLMLFRIKGTRFEAAISASKVNLVDNREEAHREMLQAGKEPMPIDTLIAQKQAIIDRNTEKLKKAQTEPANPTETFALSRDLAEAKSQIEALQDLKARRERQNAPQPAADDQNDTATPPVASEAPQATTLLGTRKFLTALLDGEVTAEQVKEQWQAFKGARTQIIADLMAMKKDDLMQLAGIRASKSDSKERLAQSALDTLMSYFNPTDSLSFSIGRDMETSKLDAMERVVATWTDEMIAQKSEDRRKAKADRERAAKAPETAAEWEQFVYNRGRQKPTPADTIEFKKLKGRAQFQWLMARGERMLTPEELAGYDAVRAKDTKQITQNREESKAFVQGVTAPTETEIIETKHTQKGHDLFVVKLADRVDRGIYDRLNGAAKKLGGYYSSFKGAGAIPGFQFRERADAEAFQAIARGESVDRSDEIAANRESKVQSAAERLEAMAERMEASADESLNADRKTNTAKRARQASGAEQTARRQIAMAKTLKNLAAAMKAGNVTHLDGITNATQVATLRQQSLRAKDASERKQDLSYQKREELKDVEPTAAQMADAEYPYPFVQKSDVLKLVELGRGTTGAKLLAERLAKVTLPRDGGEMGHISNPEMIETFRELSKKVTERGKALWETYSWKFDEYDRLQRMGIRDLPTLRAALREFVQYQGATPAADPIKMKERALVGKKWEGFFPTPAPIVDRLIAEAGIEDGMTVLEPSAGKGDIADAARAAGAQVDTVEIVGELRELLEAKGHNVIGRDINDLTPRGFTYGDTFTAPDGKTGIMRGHPGGPHSGRVRLDDESGVTLGYYFRDELNEVKKNGSNSGYDRILMNPPFEDGKDMDHVMHAFKLLRPGGKLVAVMGEGAFSRSDKKATAFREWLDSHDGTSEKLPAGSFAGADAFRQTGTSTRIVVVSRDETSGLDASPAAERDAEYMAAVESGDMETAQRMVDEAAKAAGYNVGPVWHGTPDGRFIKSNPVFKSEKERMGWGKETGVHWFADSKATASTYADDRRAFDYQNAEPMVIPAYVKLTNPLEIDGKGEAWRTAQTRGRTTDAITEAINAGNDGVVIRNVQDDYQTGAKGRTRPTSTYAVFSSNAIKSADPVTRDAQGNVIPLSQRFNPESDSILYASPAVDLRQIQEEADSTNAEKADPMGSRSLRPDALDWARRLIKGRKDVLDMDAPGAADAITDSEISAAKKRAALGQMLKAMETETIDRITKALGPDAGKSEIKARRKAFVAELLPVAARLNAVGYDSMDNLVFGEFEMRAGTLNRKFADKAAKSTGDIWIGRDGEALRIGEYIEDLKAYQLHRTMTQARQARIYRDFQDRYPELAHFLNRWIQPGQADARIVDERGTVLPAFNRHALRKFFGDVSPYGELDEVEGYVPEIARTASLAGMIVTGVQNLLNKRWKSGAREYKSGDAREFGQVKDLFTGFGIRALEAYAETERRDTAEKLLAASVREIPADGLVPPGWMKVNPDNLASLVGAYGSAHGLNEKQLAAFTAAVAKGDTETLKKLIGQAWGLLRQNKMMRKEVLAELVRPLTDRTVRNMAVAVLDSVSKSYIGGLLTHPFSWITNMGSNELFKLMRIAQQALYGATVKMMGLVDKSSARSEMQRSGSVALREAWELTKGLIYARRWNIEKINAIVPREMFESNTGISGAVSSITEEQMTAVDLLKRANVPAAILKAVGYSDMDVKAKQALAHASFVAHAQQALADHERSRGVKVPKAEHAKWMRDWLNASGPEVARQAHATAVAYAMDYENVPWWMDERTSSTGLNIIRRLVLPFIKWPYNMARQMKRFGADSALDVAAWISAKTVGRAPGAVGEAARAWQSGRKASGTKLANSVAHLATFGLMYAAMRALLAAAKDDDEVGKLGRSFDMAGDRLGREWDTSSRVNITDIAGIGTVVGALAKMNGDDGSNDFWLRTRNLPYASPMMAMAATMDALTASKEKAAGRRADALESWKSFVGDFWSEGVLMAALNTIHGNESKYTQGQGVMTTLGGMAVDLGASRVAPVPLLSAARDLVDPQMRRLNDSATLGYDPGFIDGMQSRIPGLSKNLPPKGQVTTRLLENATTELAALKDEPRASRVWVDPKSGNVKATFVDPADKRDVPRWKTLLRMTGVNVKPVDREGYKAAVKGKEARAEYKKLIKMGQ